MALGTACTFSPVSALPLSQPITGSLRSARTVDRRMAGKPRAIAAYAAQCHAVADVLHGAGQPVGDV